MVARLASVLVVLSHAVHDEEHPRSWKALPQEGDLSDDELREFWTVLDRLETPPNLSDSPNLVSWDVEDSLSTMIWKNDLLAENMQGIWWNKNHPTNGHGLFSMIGGTEVFDGSSAVDQPGYAYASLVQPMMLGVPNDDGNRSNFVQFHDLELEFAFSKFRGEVKPGDSSSFNVKLRTFFKKFPIPAAKLEGWSLGKMAKWLVDPKKYSDPAAALCYCSVIYEGPNEITRNNFGEFAYKILRVADGNGQPTNYWSDFKAEMKAQGITRLAGLAPVDKVEQMPNFV